MQSQDLNNKGLYCPSLEKDACGIGIIVNLNNNRSHKLVADALQMLAKMSHRGATGYEENTGDGAGILTHIPHNLLRREIDGVLPPEGSYGVGMMFFPNEPLSIDICKTEIYHCIQLLGFELVASRVVPTDNRELGRSALSTEPHIEQVIVTSRDRKLRGADLDRRLYFLRSIIKRNIYRKFPEWRDYFYIPSFSSRTVVYKGQLTSHQLPHYYLDLQDPRFESALALIHSRFSTNTIPKWKLAQPFRCIAHNGEINTIQGNLNWWKAREEGLVSPFYSQEELDVILPLCNKGISDSGNFDRVLEFLTMNGRSIGRSLIMMIPEAWQEDPDFDEVKRDFYKFHENVIEPWDGPASICFTDGTLAGATVDRNGLRPSRYLLTDDNTLILASEAGCIDIPPEKVVMKSQLEPGKILIADLDEHRIIGDDELKSRVCKSAPYSKWVKNFFKPISDLPEPSNGVQKHYLTGPELIKRKSMFGLSREDQELIIRAMSEGGKEPIGSMGADIPLAVLSKTPQHVSHYLKQDFAQVTNPPIDSLRERAFMSLKCTLGPSFRMLGKLDQLEEVISLDSPVLNLSQLNKTLEFFKDERVTLDMVFDPAGGQSLEDAIDHLTVKAIHAASMGKKLIYLSHQKADQYNVPIPSLLLGGAIHHALIRLGLRRASTILVDACDVWETHHAATLLGYGCDAVMPRLAIETSQEIMGALGIKHYLKAMDKGLLKIMSKLGVSTIASYKGAQTFEALGISQRVVDKCFTETISRIGGMTFEMIEEECIQRHIEAFDPKRERLTNQGIYQWRPDGEYHLFNPKSIHLLQHSTRTGDYNIYKKYAAEINNTERDFCTLRSLFEFKKGNSIPLEEVEPAEQILRRFATGAMSFGSLSYEAHSTLAIAMNRIGGKSNSGEGGEDPSRYKLNKDGDSERSAIKQVASGRFGVTIQYLNEADELQIKMAQGAKPGEGGQLPGHKVDDWIARVRHSTPGVGLISPPPHHDIYSIEDLAQLIYDLKNANRDARISVKLVSKAGVGIIASGVAKGKAEHILISGSDGGTGASPLSSIRHAGLPWELGLSETHQTLVRNKLRDRVTVQCDGQIRTGRDLAIATLLGAEEWGIATAALVVEGCILMRKCHLNTCPVGVATQNPELRKKFHGNADHVVNYFNFLAEDLREIMASLGFRTVDEMVGQSQFLNKRQIDDHPKAASLDLSAVFHKEALTPGIAMTHRRAQNHHLDMTADKKIIRKSAAAIERGEKAVVKLPVNSTNRAIGTMLSSVVVRKFGPEGLPEDTIDIRLKGSAGQSCGAFLATGITITLDGDTNDYMGKGLSGGKIVVRKDPRSPFKAAENAIIGNVALYGATAGKVFINGMAGQRFAVRNSGATAVVEGIGANGCEYMTGGKVIILGEIGRNFAAGMSGGVAFIYDTSNAREKVNSNLVHIEKPGKADLDAIYSLISSHYTLTNSETAGKLLSDWDSESPRFIKIIPAEYKKAIAKTKVIAATKMQAQSANV